ncbi:MAG: hypothetical protein M1829_000127 [Trizodia sp. TS-e1964]|nr:MAG: hypothetical protein M1829_000127 [Trizodia sp. TS-e1964]
MAYTPFPTKSPFSIALHHLDLLQRSEGFRIVREHLGNDEASSFCTTHHACTEEEKSTWLLHRDITHVLILPILQIHRRASQLAASMLHSWNAADLELAFTGDARGTFSWLQCFVADEPDFLATRGCPACIVSHVLYSEPTIRLILVASRLSEALDTPKDGRPVLPTMVFWRDTLREALENDGFWGTGYFEDIEPRATTLQVGIQDLISQCCDLEHVVSNSLVSTSEVSLATMTPPMTPRSASPAPMQFPNPGSQRKQLRVSSSNMAKHQIKLVNQEEQWRRRIIVSYWTSLLTEMVSPEFLVSPVGRAIDRRLLSVAGPHHLRALTA